MEVQFPINISYGATGGAGWSTRLEAVDAGYELRSVRWSRQRGKWMVARELTDPAEWAQLITLHRVARGRLHGFRFQDWSDYQVGAGEGVLIANAAGHAQLAKQYQVLDYISGAPVIVQRPIHKPQPGTVVFSPPGPTVDETTGVVTGGSIGVTTWTGQFDVPVRFDSDQCELHYRDFDIVDWPGIPLVELRMRDA